MKSSPNPITSLLTIMKRGEYYPVETFALHLGLLLLREGFVFTSNKHLTLCVGEFHSSGIIETHPEDIFKVRIRDEWYEAL